MGMGLCTMEEVLIDPETGKLLSDSTWTYKIPTAADVPRSFNVTFLKDTPNLRSVMSSKASGEPAMMLSMSVLYALRRAVLAAKNSMSEIAAKRLSLHHDTTAQSTSRGSISSGYDDGEAVSGGAELRQDDAGTTLSVDAGGETSTSCVIGDAADGNPFFVLEAPVTTCHGKEAVGQFNIADMLQAASDQTARPAGELECHSSGEWVVVH